MRTDQSRAPSLRLVDYYLIEGASAFATTLFLLSIFFWAKARYGFSNTENLALGALQGVGHIIAANIGGRLGDRFGYNRILVLGLAGVALTSLFGWLPESRIMPYVVGGAYAIFIGLTWPVLEGGAMHIPGRINMPQRLGIYNMVWSFSGLAGFALSGWIFAWRIDSIFWVPAAIHGAQLLWIYYHRGRHRIEGHAAMAFPHEGDRHPPATKRELTRLSWLSNSLAYFLAGGFAALTPHLGERLGLNQSWTIWLGCVLLLARALGFVALYRWHGWHYHRGWGGYALWSAPLWLALVFFTNSIALVAAGCLLLGFSFGLSYYMSIYYSLDGSENKGEEGGRHEAIIGLGILTGPLAGAAGGAITGSTAGAKLTIILLAVLLSAAGFLVLRRIARAD
jgi:MFS family permease